MFLGKLCMFLYCIPLVSFFNVPLLCSFSRIRLIFHGSFTTPSHVVDMNVSREEAVLFLLLSASIQRQLTVPQDDVNNRWWWNLHSSNNYIVSSVYNFLQQLANQHIIAYENHVLWHKDVPL